GIMNTQEIAKRYVELCQQGKMDACLEELYAKNAVSVEAAPPPGGEKTAKGLDAIKAKGKDWGASHVVHSAEVNGPFPNENRFAVRFVFDVTEKPSGKRTKMDEVGLFTVENGKITREEFFYSTDA
ncbi:MAG TPA: nuclear transport factor 2 family protein, partial [Polyangia bacterium]|nr:nuclear transport factor 2 family protein [Polyangia bacterium]